MLKRRFSSFVGIGYNLDVLENGITRLDTIPKRFAEDTINEYNNCIADISSDRNKMYDRWFELIDTFGGSKIKMTNQLETDKDNIGFNLCTIEPKRILRFIITFAILLLFFALVEGTMNLLYVAVTRASDKCFHFGLPSTINMAIKKKENFNRQTFMQNLLKTIDKQG